MSFLYNSGRPGDHAPFMETPGNAGRLGRSAIDSNNMLYKTFKYSHGEEMYTEVLKFSLSTSKSVTTNQNRVT